MQGDNCVMRSCDFLIHKQFPIFIVNKGVYLVLYIYKMNNSSPDASRDIAPTMTGPRETVNFVSPVSQWKPKETVMVKLNSFAEAKGLSFFTDSSLNT